MNYKFEHTSLKTFKANKYNYYYRYRQYFYVPCFYFHLMFSILVIKILN